MANTIRGFYMKMTEADDKLLGYVMTKLETAEQKKAIIEALKSFKENHEQLATLKNIAEQQKQIIAMLKGEK